MSYAYWLVGWLVGCGGLLFVCFFSLWALSKCAPLVGLLAPEVWKGWGLGG